MVLAVAMISALPAWWLLAWPVLVASDPARHAGHFALVYAHMLGGTCMLVLGSMNLYIGASGRWMRFHRYVGYGYLGGGTLGACAALSLALATVHGKIVRPFAYDLMLVSDPGWALASLATAWLICAAMGFRAARNRRIDNHRAWMIRSYVLAWSFVLCRLIGKIPALAFLGELGNGAAVGWLSWLVPLALVEVALQWRAGAAVTRKPGVATAGAGWSKVADSNT
jgi:hypothetical protein